MFFKTFINSKISIVSVLAILGVGLGLFLLQTPAAHAQMTSTASSGSASTNSMSISELQAMIAKLQARLSELSRNTGSQGFSGPKRPVATSTSELSKQYCTIGNQKFSVGVKRTSIVDDSGNTSVIADAHYICRIKDGKGVWVIEGSMPKPIDATFKTAISGLKATVTFTLNNGCGGYVISWGDGSKTEQAGAPAGSKCTMAIVNVTKDHTYTKAGTYEVKVDRSNGSRSNGSSVKEIKVGSDTKPSNPVCVKGSSSQSGASFARRPGTDECLGKETPSFPSNSSTAQPQASTTTVKPNKECKWGEKMYGQGVAQPNNSGFTSRASAAGSALTCQNGEWKTAPAASQCQNGIAKYSEGDKLQSINDGVQTKTVSDGSFVCRTGKWVVEGSAPGRTPQSGASTSRSGNNPAGSVKGASTDIITEISVTLQNIKNILTDLK